MQLQDTGARIFLAGVTPESPAAAKCPCEAFAEGFLKQQLALAAQ